MDFNIEISFVKKHIRKDYQDRLIFELQSKKHREKAISRFSHNSQNILKNSFEQYKMLDLQKVILPSVDLKQKCYIISHDENDGKSLSLQNAIECCKKTYMVMILISETIVVIKEEFEKKEAHFFVSKQ